jgi:CRISPR-associated protein Cas2
MQILLVYDIVNDSQRAKVADACLDYGLDRIQYSAFAGLLNRTHQEELMMRIESIIGDGAACIHLYPIDETAWQKRLILERGIEKMEMDDDVPQSADE